MAKMKWILAGLALSAAFCAQAEPTCYTADADSGSLAFSGDAEGNRFQGHFRQFSVRLCLEDADLETARIEVEVATGSATVGNRQGDQALLDDELFAAERYPQAEWSSGEIEQAGPGYLAQGELSLRGIKANQPVRLALEQNSEGWQLTGEASIQRLNFDVGLGEFSDPEFISPEIRLTFNLALAPEA